MEEDKELLGNFEIKKLDLKDGDIVVLEYIGKDVVSPTLNIEAYENAMAAQLRQASGADISVVVIPNNWKLTKVEQ